MTDANEYGKALFLITEEDAVSDSVLADVKTAERVFKANPDYVKLLNQGRHATPQGRYCC